MWRSRVVRTPRDAHEVVAILGEHREGNIRALGALHSWSDVAVSDDVTLDMSAMRGVELLDRATYGVDAVGIEAGCPIQDVLDFLRPRGLTLPTLGVIKRQTISGAISTGTHGSGLPGLSHFVLGMAIAAYDAQGNPAVREVRSGDALRAVRCGVARTGVILRVDMPVVPLYLVDEAVVGHASVESILARYAERPLTQFLVIPYSWGCVAFERAPRVARPLSPREKGAALWWRLYSHAWIDVGFHLLLKTALLLGTGATRGLMKALPSLMLRYHGRVDDAEHVLTTAHYLFRHEEMEVFVPQSRLVEALAILRAATEVFAGTRAQAPADIAATIGAVSPKLLDELHAGRGAYTQHYPFFFRRVMPEDALVSMASGVSEPMISISVFTYCAPSDRAGYCRYCAWLARCMHRLFGARLHWGKHFPPGLDAMAGAYPGLEAFRAYCASVDPKGVFGNADSSAWLAPRP